MHMSVSGRVQGVGFRWWVRKHAKMLGLVGYAKNEDDGTVTIIACGHRNTLERLSNAIKTAGGPHGADVSRAEVSWHQIDEPRYTRFQIH